MKTCTKCGEEKELGEFYRHKGGRDGFMSMCKECQKEYMRGNYRSNEEQRMEYARKYREEHKEKGREYARNYREVNKGKVRESQANTREKHRFSIALQQSRKAAKKNSFTPCNATVEELKFLFNGKCEICGIPELEMDRRLCMDHDHETGEFRGFLCRECNILLGGAKDSEDILINALHYVMNCKKKAEK